MLKDCDYNKIKILTELSRLAWHIKKFAKKDAKKHKHSPCHKLLMQLEKDLEKYIKKLTPHVKKTLK